MSRLSKNDIKPSTTRIVNRISVQRLGTWTFATIPGDNFSAKTKYQRFYLMSEPFGLCTSRQNNPAKTIDRGKPGDYIAVSYDGQLVIVTKASFDLKYPVMKPTVSMPVLTSASYVLDKKKQDVLQKTINPTTNTLTQSYNTSSGGPLPGVSPGVTSPNTTITTTTSTRIY